MPSFVPNLFRTGDIAMQLGNQNVLEALRRSQRAQEFRQGIRERAAERKRQKKEQKKAEKEAKKKRLTSLGIGAGAIAATAGLGAVLAPIGGSAAIGSSAATSAAALEGGAAAGTAATGAAPAGFGALDATAKVAANTPATTTAPALTSAITETTPAVAPVMAPGTISDVGQTVGPGTNALAAAPPRAAPTVAAPQGGGVAGFGKGLGGSTFGERFGRNLLVSLPALAGVNVAPILTASGIEGPRATQDRQLRQQAITARQANVDRSFGRLAGQDLQRQQNFETSREFRTRREDRAITSAAESKRATGKSEEIRGKHLTLAQKRETRLSQPNKGKKYLSPEQVNASVTNLESTLARYPANSQQPRHQVIQKWWKRNLRHLSFQDREDLANWLNEKYRFIPDDRWKEVDDE